MDNLTKLKLQQQAMEKMAKNNMENMFTMLEENAKILSGINPYEVEEELPVIQVEPAEDPFFVGQILKFDGLEVTVSHVSRNSLNAIAQVSTGKGTELQDVLIPRDFAIKALAAEHDALLYADDARDDEVA